MKYLLLIALIAMIGCSTPKDKLTAGGVNVQVFEDKPLPGCEIVGNVVGENDFGSIAVAKNHARNLAAAKGGNYLEIKDEILNGKSAKVHALAYLCP
jgi:hypothetical protein